MTVHSSIISQIPYANQSFCEIARTLQSRLLYGKSDFVEISKSVGRFISLKIILLDH